MIDLHCHILPNVDDGARGLEDSLAMAYIAAADGVRTIVATPHNGDIAGGQDEAAWHLEALRGHLSTAGIDLQLVLGAENFLEPNIVDLVAQGRAWTIGSGPYILVELPLVDYPIFTEQAVFQLQVQGYVPIIVHPERNGAFQRDEELLAGLVEKGALAQITAASLLGDFGGRTRAVAESMVRRNMVHIIASDAHSPTGHRSPALSPGVEAAARLIGAERAREMVTTVPEMVLAGRRLEPEAPLPALRRRSWAFWSK